MNSIDTQLLYSDSKNGKKYRLVLVKQYIEIHLHAPLRENNDSLMFEYHMFSYYVLMLCTV